MKTLIVILAGVVFVLGCARVRVEAPKEPIKVDISMRLDVYQHVLKDIDAIEGMVSGGNRENKLPGNRSLLNYFICSAYAKEGLSPEVEEAALRRKERYSEITSWLEKAVIGENRAGFSEVRNEPAADASLRELVKAENEDRMVIYRALAQKNNTSIEEIQKLYATRLQNDAPTGAPIEVLNEATAAYEWKIK